MVIAEWISDVVLLNSAFYNAPLNYSSDLQLGNCTKDNLLPVYTGMGMLTVHECSEAASKYSVCINIG